MCAGALAATKYVAYLFVLHYSSFNASLWPWVPFQVITSAAHPPPPPNFLLLPYPSIAPQTVRPFRQNKKKTLFELSLFSAACSLVHPSPPNLLLVGVWANHQSPRLAGPMLLVSCCLPTDAPHRSQGPSPTGLELNHRPNSRLLVQQKVPTYHKYFAFQHKYQSEVEEKLPKSSQNRLSITTAQSKCEIAPNFGH